MKSWFSMWYNTQNIDIIFSIELLFQVSFSGEKAIDTGGVTRDMLSAFWEEAFT